MQHYASKYPRGGQIAILCEGDLAGYEADLLESWTAQQLDLGLVDVWPCGTKTAIYGLSDSIGRAIAVNVIEDRDHRSSEVAEKDCAKYRKDRSTRGVKIGFWKAWRRNEIENYLIEPPILFPVFAEVFGTSEAAISASLQEILTNTALDQSLQRALAEFRAAFPNGEKEVGGVSRKDGRPNWSKHGFAIPDNEKVKDLLAKVMDESVRKLSPDNHPQVQKYLDLFIEKSEAWGKMKVGDMEWREQWAGKEVLGWLRVKLAAEIGWPKPESPSQRSSVHWESLSRAEYGDWDRRIERFMQPKLVRCFLKTLASGTSHIPDIASEWNDLITDLRSSVPAIK